MYNYKNHFCFQKVHDEAENLAKNYFNIKVNKETHSKLYCI